MLKSTGSAQERTPLLGATECEISEAPACHDKDTLESACNLRPPDSLAALQSTGVRITRVAGPDTGFADVTVAVPDEPLGRGPWPAVPAWTSFSVSRAFLGRASPVLRRTLEDRAQRGESTSLLLEWAPCASRPPVEALLYALYGKPLKPTLADAVELRSLLQYWWAPAVSPWQASDFLPTWPTVQQRCVATVTAHLKPGHAAGLYERARRCGDLETESEVVAWAGRTDAAQLWLLELDDAGLHQVFDHPDFGMAPVQRVRTLLAWAEQQGEAHLTPSTRADLHQVMRWNALDDASARALGLRSLVRAVDLGLLAPDAGFQVLRRLGDAALPAARAPAAPLPGQVRVPILQPADAAPAAAGSFWRGDSEFWEAARDCGEVAGWLALNVAGNALTAGSAVLGGALLQGAYHGDWRLLRSALGSAWVGGVYGAVEGGIGYFRLSSEYDVGSGGFRERFLYQTASGAALGAFFGLGAGAGFAAYAVCAWPFHNSMAPGPGLAAATTVGAALGGLGGLGSKLVGLGTAFDIFD